MSRYSVGIIGYGDFTKLMLEYLQPYADVVVYSRSTAHGDAGYGAVFTDVSTVLSQPVIIPSIPSQFFEEFFLANRDLINPTAVVIDVCSVKVRPLEVLTRLLPETCQIIGTHPMFGPSSVQKNKGVKGLKCVVCPVRASSAVEQEVGHFLREVLSLQILIHTPEEHDRVMAYVQGLSHYIARLMDTMNIPETQMSTLAYDDLLAMKNVQAQDSWELFYSIMHDNPYAKEVNDHLKQAIEDMDKKIWQG